jgi:hypothetical protein
VAYAAPSGFVVAVVALIISVLLMQPSGYRAEYAPPQNLVTALEKHHSPAEEKANDLVGQLAQIVADDAPVVGTHFEGTKEVRDHVNVSSESNIRFPEVQHSGQRRFCRERVF